MSARRFARYRRVVVIALALLAFALVVSYGATEIRIQNLTEVDFTEVSIAGQDFGDLPAGQTSEYKVVPLTFRYGVMRLTANGKKMNTQSLSLWSSRFTHRIRAVDIAKGHLKIDVVRE